ncbi:MAG TPA: class I SAM-dependent methyltransferase [Baekduia sp.]|nr:class I SAM-dependent methyltransferase [Baekduia sp.]
MVDDPVAETYARLAPHYDAFTRGNDHGRWLRGLERLAQRHGLRGRTVLDVACGTGRSLRPLVDLGYRGHGCDLSPAMLDIARERLPGVELSVADMRALPDLGRFDWITCLNDALNYLLGDDELAAALRAMARLLRAGGVITFDLNSLAEHRDGFEQTWVVEEPEAYLCWRGRGCASTPGHPGSADIDIFVRRGDTWVRDLSRHAQRWWSHDDVEAAAAAAGLRVVARHGQTAGARLHDDADEQRHRKIVYLLRHRDDHRPRGGAT